MFSFIFILWINIWFCVALRFPSKTVVTPNTLDIEMQSPAHLAELVSCTVEPVWALKGWRGRRPVLKGWGLGGSKEQRGEGATTEWKRGHRWDCLVLIQGSLPSQGSSGTVMSVLGRGGRQTKGWERWWGNHRGMTKKTSSAHPQMAAVGKQWMSMAAC